MESTRDRVARAIEAAVAPQRRLVSLGERPVAVYGAGGMGLKVHRMLEEHGIHPRFFLDLVRGGQGEVEGVPILHPDDRALTAAERARLDVIVAVFNPDADPQEIGRLLSAAGYQRTMSFFELHRQFGRELGDQYWLTTPAFYVAHAQDIVAAADLWSDPHSRQLFAALIEFRVGRPDAPLPTPTLDDQYFPADLPTDPRSLRLVDCGAYLGDTIESARRHVPRIESICAFEPDPDSFGRLASWARTHRASLGFELQLWPCGVGASLGSSNFLSSGGGGSRFDARGTRVALQVALDDALPTYQATLLKMDIEGAEPDALAGARMLIARARPRLAVSVYHTPEHLWTIPELVREMVPACDLHLRLHRFNGFDVVLYALPRP